MSMASHSHPVANPRIDAVRRFSRFYTKRIGVLQEGLLDSPFSLTEARVLYELAHRDRPTATALGTELGLDPGYLSRILRALEKRSLVAKTRSAADGRESFLSLTAEGRKAFSRLDQSSADSVRALLSDCSVREQQRLVDAMEAIERILGPRAGGAAEDRAATAPARRHRLGRPSARRPLCAGARLRRVVRSARRRDRDGFPAQARSGARALLDRRGRRRDRRLGVSRPQVRARRQAASAAGRAPRARARRRAAARRRVHRFRAAGRLSADHAVDAARARRGAQDLRACGIPARERAPAIGASGRIWSRKRGT